MPAGFVIAIDGPVASGKGTVAPALAKKLKGFHIYTGGTYRATALFCLRNNIDVNNEEEVEKVLSDISVDLIDDKVILNGEDVTEEIKKRDVANATSPVSTIKKVREKALITQRKVAEREVVKGGVVVAEGRDTATRVFPDADIKIYLTADPEVRAKRRQEQYREKGEDVKLENVLEEINERDERDMNRGEDPLPKNPEEYGYFIVNNSNQSEEETIKVIIEELKKRRLI